jgi:hypothetical protein
VDPLNVVLVQRRVGTRKYSRPEGPEHLQIARFAAGLPTLTFVTAAGAKAHGESVPGTTLQTEMSIHFVGYNSTSRVLQNLLE